MKYIFILLLFALAGCKQEPAAYHNDWQKVNEQMAERLNDCDSANYGRIEKIELLEDSCRRLNKCVDSLKTGLFLSKYKIEKVRYYLKICLKNPTQDKFLKGWIRRAIE